MNFPATHSPEFIKIPVNFRSSLIFILTFLIISPNSTNSQSSFSSATDEKYSSSSDSVTKFQPSLAVVIGVLSIVFSLSFIVLIYAKCCRLPSSIHHGNFGNLPRSRSRFSGIDRRTIGSLPVFKFSTLKGSKDGLECSVCLSGFEDIEVLRLLPKCKHAFHVDCIDQWLEHHSSCPLCRVKVVVDDIALFGYSSSLRFQEPESDDPSGLELFIEREGSSRFGPTVETKDRQDQDQEILHRYNHRIMIVGDHDPMILKNRWSNVTPSDLLFLKSEMVACMSSNQFDRHQSPEKMGNSVDGDRKSIDSGGRRSVSEITVHPRFLEIRVEEERLRSVWLPIARETVQKFAHNENRIALNGQRLKVDQNSEELLNVV